MTASTGGSLISIIAFMVIYEEENEIPPPYVTDAMNNGVEIKTKEFLNGTVI